MNRVLQVLVLRLRGINHDADAKVIREPLIAQLSAHLLHHGLDHPVQAVDGVIPQRKRHSGLEGEFHAASNTTLCGAA